MNASATRSTNELEDVVRFLRDARAVTDKIRIERAWAPALSSAAGFARLGDDCAAFPDGSGGYLLLAAEGLLADFVSDDPWFAGYCAVMVNVSDVCAMGGRPTALVDVIWSPAESDSELLWAGMRAAAEAYGVPIVGGHTTWTRGAGPVHLAAAILGRANALLTSFDAEPGDDLIMAVDLDGAYRGDKPFWNASVGSPPERLRALATILPEIADLGLARAAKDISNGGVVGTLVMLLACSGVGARLDLDALPRPPGVELAKWLVSFPSFGFLVSVSPSNRERVLDSFLSRGVACAVVGSVGRERSLELVLGVDSTTFWRAR